MSYESIHKKVPDLKRRFYSKHSLIMVSPLEFICKKHWGGEVKIDGLLGVLALKLGFSKLIHNYDNLVTKIIFNTVLFLN